MRQAEGRNRGDNVRVDKGLQSATCGFCAFLVEVQENIDA